MRNRNHTGAFFKRPSTISKRLVKVSWRLSNFLSLKQGFAIIASRISKRYLLLGLVAVLILVLINSVIHAHITGNYLEGKKIILDPGHGGIDGGTNDGATFLEKEINLQIALQLKKTLESYRASVDMTRDKDISLDNLNKLSSSRHERDLLARVSMFNSGKYDLFVSIHVNRSSNPRALGPMVLCYKNSPKSQYLASCIQESLNTHMLDVLGPNSEHKIFKSDYFVLRKSSIPGVIVETGFISNPTEKRLLREESHQLKLAKAISAGLNDYFTDPDAFIQRDKESSPSGDTSPEDEDSTPFQPVNEVQLVMK